MPRFYSKTTNGFYDPAVNAAMPPDAVAVTDAAYAALFAAQAAGEVISPDGNGNPQAVAPPAPSAASVAVSAGMALLAEGIAITSTGFPALNGTYSLSSETMLNMTGMMAYVEAKSAFPGGVSTLTWYDETGAAHVFTTVAEYEAFAEAVCAFVTQVQEYMNSGGSSGSLPANTVAIA